ncbi:Fe(3+)-hydroxamate ABC transporter permease FhuB [Chelativorans alearense]|uniref:Fe(3+)-hydroxamate ABC transporter permease FhuB n=1 Tax=Chelativorans alearense TaxID=2681495 RepID=UPI0013D83F7C|nr:Fe(3+)-hydroxamate ABC transporter permease FhuB [Chelativorans alearense]
MQPRFRLASISLLLFMLLGGLLATVVAGYLSSGGYWEALVAPDPSSASEMRVHYSVLPRLAVSLQAGAALGLAGALLQQVLRNPLASPSTLGISAGAQFALSLALLWAPSLIEAGRDLAAVAGGAAAAGIVLALSWRRGLEPFSVVLAGLVVGLTLSAASAALVLHNERYLEGLFLWGSGALTQYDWHIAGVLWPRLLLACFCAVLMLRPLAMLDVDTVAGALGVNLLLTRLAALAVAVALTAVVAAHLGVIGFVGLAAPAFVRAAGARRFWERLVWAPIAGALLLTVTDLVVQLLSDRIGVFLPTGAVTAFLGAPVLLWLLRDFKARGIPPTASRAPGRRAIAGSSVRIALMLTAFGLMAWLALSLGRTPDGGWELARGLLWNELLPWRWPRVLGSTSAGAMLALAGVILQRYTGNPMASPEVLGITSGAGLGLVAALFVTAEAGFVSQTLFAVLGAGLSLVLILWLSSGARRSPSQFLLVGVALTAFLSTLFAVLMATGDPRMLRLLAWMSGSTYDVLPQEAVLASAAAVFFLFVTPFVARWLDILPLGAEAAQSLGLHLQASRIVLLVLAAAMTAAATLLVGPLTFVGLMAPHLARQMGFVHARPQLLAAAVLAAMMMLAADWLGRTIDFPWQLPAGLIATLLASPPLMWLLARRTE